MQGPIEQLFLKIEDLRALGVQLLILTALEIKIDILKYVLIHLKIVSCKHK